MLLAALADSRGSHGIAFDLLLLAVPCAAVAALTTFGSFLAPQEAGVGALQVLGSALVVLLLTLSCAVRSTAVHGLPPLAFSTVFACLGIFALQAGGPVVSPRLRSLARPARGARVAPRSLREVSELSRRERAA